MGALSGELVLDLGNWRGAFCGAVLADLGADVVVVEDLGGDSARRHPPFLSEMNDLSMASGYWQAYAAGKRSLALDLNTPDGRRVLQRLILRAGFLIEALPVCRLEELGLTYASLHETNPRLIVVSVTPFGRLADDSLFEADGLAVASASGFVYTTGSADRPPVLLGGEQAFLHGCSYAAAGAMLAHTWRGQHGEGAQVDASAQEALSLALGVVMPEYQLNRKISHRIGDSFPGRLKRRSVYPCLDGYVGFSVTAGRPVRLLDWMVEVNHPGAVKLREDQAKLDIAHDDQATLESVENRVAEFFATRTRGEIWSMALERGMLIYPIVPVAEAVHSEVHSDRGFFEDGPVTGLNRLVKVPMRLLPADGGRMATPAPRLGEHTVPVLRQYGFSDEEIEALWLARII